MTDFTDTLVLRNRHRVTTRSKPGRPSLKVTRIAARVSAERWTRAGILLQLQLGRYAFQARVAAARKDNA